MAEDEEGTITLLGSFQKNNQEVVCAGVNTWQGKYYFFLRVFVPIVGSEELTPTQKGVNLPYVFIDEFSQGVRNFGEVMGGDQVVKTIIKGDNREIRFSTNTYKGQSLIDIREFIIPKEGGKAFATKKGISIRTEQFPILIEIVEKLSFFVKSELKKSP